MSFLKRASDRDGDKTRNARAPKSHLGHMWMMALCCGAPLILLLAISLLGTGLPGVRAVLLSLLPFICPILMIGMLPMMFLHGHHDSHCQDQKRDGKPE